MSLFARPGPEQADAHECRRLLNEASGAGAAAEHKCSFVRTE